MVDTEQLVIEHIGHFGDGVAVAHGQYVYVPYALAGETVEVAPVPGHPDRRRLLKIEHASPERIAPFCPHFGVCGGCAIQHWDDERYRAWKRSLVAETLAQMKIECEVFPLIDAHGAGRRRITLHARMGTHEVLKVGFAAAGSHDIIPIDRCPVLAPGLGGAIDVAWAIAEPLISTGKPLDIQLTATDNGLDADVRGSGPLPARMIATMSGIAEQHRLARLTRHGELVLMRSPPVDHDRHRSAHPAAGVVPAGDGRRRRGAGRAGGQSLQTRKACRRPVLRGRAVRAPARGGVADRGVRQRRRRGRGAAEGGDLDARSEAGQVRGALTCSAVRWCHRNCATTTRSCSIRRGRARRPKSTQLAAQQGADRGRGVLQRRDASRATQKILIDGGYAIEGVTPVDQFRHTPHVELVAKFSRKR